MPALDFPTSPTLGQQYNDWVWNGAQWDFRQTLPGGLPAGSIIQWGGSTAPVNWLLCDGSAVSRTTYSSLFAAVGTSYGAGNGTTTFNLPDLRGRVPVGKNGGSFGTLGATGGAETVALDGNNLPAHTHTFSATTSTNGDHAHNYTTNQSNATFSTGGGTGMDRPNQLVNNGTTTTNGAHTHTVSGTTSSSGSSTAHNNLQPYQVVNYIIKATAAVTPGESELAPRVSTLEEVRPVNIGGTGATSFTSGAYLKGAGTSAVTAQTGIPIADVSGSLSIAQGGTGVTTGAGLVPVIPTSVSVGSGSASVSASGLITFTGASSVSINGCFTSAYTNYRIMFNESAATAYADGNLRLRAAGTDAATAYYRNGILSDAATVSGFSNSSDSWIGNVLTTHPTTSNAHAQAAIEIREPFVAKPTTFQCITHAWSGSLMRFLSLGGFNTNVNSYDGFSVILSSGNFGGTFRIYGYN